MKKKEKGKVKVATPKPIIVAATTASSSNDLQELTTHGVVLPAIKLHQHHLPQSNLLH
jgi:hypothetical protein